MSDDYNETSGGQLEIDNIDTPLGQAAEDYIKAVEAAEKAEQQVDEEKLKVLEIMEDEGMRTFIFKENLFTETKEKTVLKSLRVTKQRKKAKKEE